MGPVLAEPEAWGWAPLDTLNSKGQFRCDVRAGEQDCGHPAWEGRQLPEAVTADVSGLPVPFLLYGSSQGKAGTGCWPMFHSLPHRTFPFSSFVAYGAPGKWFKAPLRGNPRRWPKGGRDFPEGVPLPNWKFPRDPRGLGAECPNPWRAS